MSVAVQPRGFQSSSQPPRGNWHAIAMALMFGIAAGTLGGCSSSPKVTTAPENSVQVGTIFPSALMAEPIQLRAGYIHTTQLFQIKESKERWTVALGFVRSDTRRSIEQKVDEAYDVCWVRGPGKGMGYMSCTKSISPGFNLRWELLSADGEVASGYEFDSLREESGGTYSGVAITRTLSGFSGQAPGQYRLRVTVLRDGKELDFLKPHIVVDRPFFGSRYMQ